ncbi:MAG: hypothetical protein M3081_19580, partial [Gemmatimonadota bacterium]|nr:hypothetical protein [Gemmatimonadota bacterium]
FIGATADRLVKIKRQSGRGFMQIDADPHRLQLTTEMHWRRMLFLNQKNVSGILLLSDFP